MSQVLEEKPKTTVKEAPKKEIKAEEKLPKYALLYFGDIVGRNTVLRYLKGEVVGNKGHIDPSKQLVIFTLGTADSGEDSKLSKGLDLLSTGYGKPNEITQIKSNFKNQSDAYFHSFNDAGLLTKILETMGDDIQFLVFPHDSSCFSGLADIFNVPLLETGIDVYNNGTNKGKAPKRLIYENSGKDIIVETQKYFELIRDLYQEKKDDVANELLSTVIVLDTGVLAEGKGKRNMKNYLEARDKELPLTIEGTIDNDKNKRFYISQYK